MAKRFTDSEKWKRPSFRRLSPDFKLLYLYLFDSCDHAGLWEEDLELATFQIKSSKALTPDSVRDALGDIMTIVNFRGRTIYFLPEFIEEQYGARLNELNKVHASALARLKKFGIEQEETGAGWIYFNNEPLIKPLTSPLQGAKEKDKEKEKDKAKDKGGEPSGKIYPAFVEVYSNFFKAQVGAPLLFSAQEGAFAKKIIGYISEFDSVLAGDKTVVEVWEYILSKWDTLEPFYQKSVKLSQIYSNLPNIIRQINPKHKSANNERPKKDHDLGQLADVIREARSAGSPS